MNEQFVNEFVASVSSNFDEDTLRKIFKKLTVFVNGYEIKPVETSVALYVDYIPECYQTYFVTRKIIEIWNREKNRTTWRISWN